MTQRITINEAQLKNIIRASIMETIQDNPELMEGWFNDVWGGVKSAGRAVGQAASQHANSIKANYYAGAARSKGQEIESEIAKCKQTIEAMNQRIAQLKAQQSNYIEKSSKATKMANQMARDRGTSTGYNSRVDGIEQVNGNFSTELYN